MTLKSSQSNIASFAAIFPSGDEIGDVVAFYAVPSAAIIRVKASSLKVGDAVWIRGSTTDLKETVRSMEIDRQPVMEARAGQEVGIKVSAKVRKHDRVYKISA